MKSTLAKHNPDKELLTQQAFVSSPKVLARDNKVPIMTVSVASDRVFFAF